MFNKSSAALRAAAIKSEGKAQKALALAQTRQARAAKQTQLAADLEIKEAVANLEKEALASKLLYQQANDSCRLAETERDRAAAVLASTERALFAAEEARQKASSEYSATRSRVANLKASLKKETV